MSAPAIEAHQATEVEKDTATLCALRAEICAVAGFTATISSCADDAPIPAGAKKVYFIRHGEGQHNVAQREWRADPGWDGASEPYTMDNDPDWRYIDAELTGDGIAQAEALQARSAALSCDTLVVSPLRRATATGLLACAPLIATGRLRIAAHELAHERAGRHTCDRRLPIAQLRSQFDAVDYGLLESEEDPYWGDGRTREPLPDVARRAAEFAAWLRDVPQQQLIVATHSAFLLSIFNAVFTPADGEKPELTRWFGTGEMRAVIIRFA